MDPVYVSKSTARSIWQEYRIFSNRVEIDTKFGLLAIPFEHIESAEVPSLKSRD